MEIIKVVLVAIGLMSLVVLGLAIQIIFKKSHKFPEIHIGRNREMKKLGIGCATSYDREEQKKARKSILYESLHLSNDR